MFELTKLTFFALAAVAFETAVIVFLLSGLRNSDLHQAEIHTLNVLVFILTFNTAGHGLEGLLAGGLISVLNIVILTLIRNDLREKQKCSR